VSFARFAVALAQTVVHLLLAAVVIWLAAEIAGGAWHVGLGVWLLGLAAALLAGATAGTTVFAAFMLLVHKVRGEQAQACANQVFTGQSIGDYKNLLRMHLGADGGLTIHPLGVDAACREWDLAAPEPAPRFEPRGEPPRMHRIDEVLRFDASGDRVP
jgi:hypothetical protein